MIMVGNIWSSIRRSLNTMPLSSIVFTNYIIGYFPFNSYTHFNFSIPTKSPFISPVNENKQFYIYESLKYINKQILGSISYLICSSQDLKENQKPSKQQHDKHITLQN